MIFFFMPSVFLMSWRLPLTLDQMHGVDCEWELGARTPHRRSRYPTRTRVALDWNPCLNYCLFSFLAILIRAMLFLDLFAAPSSEYIT